jgi:hypothetical protein
MGIYIRLARILDTTLNMYVSAYHTLDYAEDLLSDKTIGSKHRLEVELGTMQGIDREIALIYVAVDDAFLCMDAAMRFARYLMNDSDVYRAENLQKLEAELPAAHAGIATAIKSITLLKNELEKQ